MIVNVVILINNLAKFVRIADGNWEKTLIHLFSQ